LIKRIIRDRFVLGVKIPTWGSHQEQLDNKIS
jgi:hypothetical protein